MNVAIAVESRFVRTPDGAVWSLGWVDASFWDRYLAVFDGVRVLGRVQCQDSAPPGSKRADSNGVTFHDLPYYIGPWQLARRYRRVRQAVGAAVNNSDALVLRAPGQISAFAFDAAIKLGKPFGVEVIGDPAEVFSSGVRSIVAPIAKRTSTASLRHACARACAVAYVSAHSLVDKYPHAPGCEFQVYSSIDLREDAFVNEPRTFVDIDAVGGKSGPSGDESGDGTPIKLICVGSLAQLYKAPDILIKALALLPNRNRFHLTFVGDGKHRRELEELAELHGVCQQVTFAGQLSSGEGVRQALDQADIFVLPSRTEGLPRAMIEAMARALPCIGSSVGGIPELLSDSELVPTGNPELLAEKISEVTEPSRLRKLSAENLEKARGYHADSLQPRREAVYRRVLHETQSWIGKQKSP